MGFVCSGVCLIMIIASYLVALLVVVSSVVIAHNTFCFEL